MKTLNNYIEHIPYHEKEGRDWLPVQNSDLKDWKTERDKLEAKYLAICPEDLLDDGWDDQCENDWDDPTCSI